MRALLVALVLLLAGSASAAVTPIASLAQYQQEVAALKASNGVGVMLYTASWCQDCKEAEKDLQSLSSAYPKVKFFTLDHDQPFAQQLRASITKWPSLPQTSFYQGTVILKQLGGWVPKAMLESYIKSYL